MPCAECEAMTLHKRNAPGHTELKPTGRHHDYKPHGQAVVKVTEYRCGACGTLWRYEDDKNDDFAGWSIG